MSDPLTTPDEQDVAEEYDGPAHLLLQGREVAVSTSLSGHFEPISGRYQWAGRVHPDDALRDVLRPNIDVRLRIESGGEVEATVREEDPWGGFRISGAGRPPFAVPSEVP